MGREKVLMLCLEFQAREAKRVERRNRGKYWKVRSRLMGIIEEGTYKKLIKGIRREGNKLMRELKDKNTNKVKHYKTKYRGKSMSNIKVEHVKKLEKYSGVQDLKLPSNNSSKNINTSNVKEAIPSTSKEKIKGGEEDEEKGEGERHSTADKSGNPVIPHKNLLHVSNVSSQTPTQTTPTPPLLPPLVLKIPVPPP